MKILGVSNRKAFSNLEFDEKNKSKKAIRMPKATKKVISDNKVNWMYKYRKLNTYLEKNLIL